MTAAKQNWPYRSIMTFVDTRKEAAATVHLASALASMFEARLIGVSACPILPPLSFADMAGLGYQIAEIALVQARSRLSQAEALFKSEYGDASRPLWFQDTIIPADFVAHRSRCADLIVVQGAGKEENLQGDVLDIGDLVLKSGRPVLVAASGQQLLTGKCVVVAWKDTREARRALLDAMPFLHRAKRVVLAEITESDEESAADVQSYLRLCGVTAELRKEAPNMDSTAEHLIQIARHVGADLLVSGGYGHSRAGEWIFGGVTRDLLRQSRISCLLSH